MPQVRPCNHGEAGSGKLRGRCVRQRAVLLRTLFVLL